MEVRQFKTLSNPPALLGFGCMRFPTLSSNAEIDKKETFRLLDYAYQNGVTYYDTAYFYHDGNSEHVLGEWIQTIDRSTIQVVTKSPFWKANTLEEFDALLEEQLNNLQVDYLDYYLMHAVNADRFEHLLKVGILEHLHTLKESGKVKHIGFSFHDSYDVFEKILKSYTWDFCQIQLNYMDVNYQAGVKGLALAESMGIPCAIMEPIRGGLLANVPDEINQKFESVNSKLSNAGWALKWVANHPNVYVVLSGMSTYEQVVDNVNTFNHMTPLQPAEEEALDYAQNFFNSRMQVKCTNCRYCMPCPFGIKIPDNFTIYNNAHIYDNKESLSSSYFFQNESVRADQCKRCMQCVSKCPQNIMIPDELAKVADYFKK